MKRYFKWIALVLIIGSIVIISKLLINNEADTSPDKDWLQRYEETSVKEEITTENGDIFVIDTYEDVYLVEKFIDIYQKVGEENHLLIKGICADQIKLRYFNVPTSGLQGYYIEDTCNLICKQNDEMLYTVIPLGNNNILQSKKRMDGILPVVYDYMLETPSGFVRYSAMLFLVTNKYEKGIQCLEQWSKGIFELEGEHEFTEEDKKLLIEESQELLEEFKKG